MKRFMLLVAILLAIASPTLLQDEDECDAASLQEAIQAQLSELETDPAAALIRIIDLALHGLFSCSDDGQDFNGEPGAQPVLGPLALDEGYYIFKLSTSGSARVDATALSSCGKDMSGAIFNISEGQAIYGAENLVQVEAQCVVFLELSKISG